MRSLPRAEMRPTLQAGGTPQMTSLSRRCALRLPLHQVLHVACDGGCAKLPSPNGTCLQRILGDCNMRFTAVQRCRMQFCRIAVIAWHEPAAHAGRFARALWRCCDPHCNVSSLLSFVDTTDGRSGGSSTGAREHSRAHARPATAERRVVVHLRQHALERAAVQVPRAPLSLPQSSR